MFQLADDLVIAVYRVSASFPAEERYGLQSQLRRAALSVATNIVEGSARRTTREYVHFLNIANGSTAEVLYLLEMAARLGLLAGRAIELETQYAEVTRGLQRMIATLETMP